MKYSEISIILLTYIWIFLQLFATTIRKFRNQFLIFPFHVMSKSSLCILRFSLLQEAHNIFFVSLNAAVFHAKEN